MITKIFTPIDESCEQSLKTIQSVLDSSSFLAGLGQHQKIHPIPKNFNAISDFGRSWYLLTSQEMWDIPDNAEGDQNFVEVIGSAVTFLGSELYDDDEAKRRESQCFSEENIKSLNELLSDKISTSYENNDIPNFLHSKLQNSDSELVSVFINEQLPQFTQSIFNDFIRGAYFGGLQKWPVSEYLLQCYLIGGFPTGWVGPRPIDGGESDKCMQVLHFGPQAI